MCVFLKEKSARGMNFISWRNKSNLKPVEIGIFIPTMKPIDLLEAGDVGYVATGLKSCLECRVGDTITLAANPAETAAARLPASQTNGLCRDLSG